MLGIDKYFVKNIKSGTQYKDIVSQYNFCKVTTTHRKVSTSKLRKVCEMIKSGVSDDEICKTAKISQEVLARVKRGDVMPSLVSSLMKEC